MINEVNVLEQTNIVRVKNAFTKDQCDAISNAIIEYKLSPSPSDTVTDINGLWTGHPHLHSGIPKDLNDLITSRIQFACSSYFDTMPLPATFTRNEYRKIGPGNWDIMAWVGVGEPDSENREHTHTNSFISGTMYFQSEGTGRIEFMSQHYVYRTMLPQWPYHGSAYYEPEDGDMLLFPSYLLHKIERNPSQHQRINMSFNAIPLMGTQ